MEDHGASQIGYCLYGPLRDSILMMGIGTAKPQALLRVIDDFDEFVGLEGRTIS
jgi:hypothetical protein